MAQVYPLIVGRLQTNCYVVQSGKECLVIDPGDEGDRIIGFIEDLGLAPKLIVATHTHFDHVLGVERLRSHFQTLFAIHKEDVPILESMQDRVRKFMGFEVPPPPKVDKFVAHGDELRVGTETLQVIHTPGHSPGSVSLTGKGLVFTGDALFNGSIGRTDLPGGDFDTLISSIKERLFQLDEETIVYSGHGPETSIGDEKLANPFVGKAAMRIR